VIPAEEVRAELDRILTSEQFIRAGRLSAFLRYSVEKTLSGGSAELKEYSVGTEVFARSAEFDPRLDPVVRVEARRLRAKLQEYYEGVGRQNAVHIVLPKGGYVPIFERPKSDATYHSDSTYHKDARRSSRFAPIGGFKAWLTMGVALATITGLAAIAYRQKPLQYVSVVVLPTAEYPEQQPFVDGLAEALAVELSRDAKWRVVAWPRFLEYRQAREGKVSIRQAAQDLGAEVVLTVGVRLREGRRHIVAILLKPERGFKEWASDYERGATDEFEIQRELARSIASDAHMRIR
jgi:TolB-like protein